MVNRAACARDACFDLLHDALKLLLRHRLIRCVLQRRDGAALRMVAHDPEEDIDGTCLGMHHLCENGFGVEGFMRELGAHRGRVLHTAFAHVVAGWVRSR